MAEQLAELNKNRGGSYSTITDTFTGNYWIDGKPIYNKVVDFPNNITIPSPTAFESSTSYSTGIPTTDIETVINAKGIDSNGSCWNVPILGIGAGNLTILNAYCRNFVFKTLVIEHTKP